MKKFEEDLAEYFETNIPEPNLSRIDKFDKLLEENKKHSIKMTYFRRIALSCMLILVIGISCMIPMFINKNNDTSPVRYYGDDDVIQVDVTDDFLRNYINENIPNYNFIFQDCNIISRYAIYDKETNSKLLALRLQLDKIDVPFTSVSMNIILNKNYTYSEHSTYVRDSIVEEVDDKKVYTTEHGDSFNYSLLCLIERQNYNTYLKLNIDDFELLEKFK